MWPSRGNSGRRQDTGNHRRCARPASHVLVRSLLTPGPHRLPAPHSDLGGEAQDLNLQPVWSRPLSAVLPDPGITTALQGAEFCLELKYLYVRRNARAPSVYCCTFLPFFCRRFGTLVVRDDFTQARHSDPVEPVCEVLSMWCVCSPASTETGTRCTA